MKRIFILLFSAILLLAKAGLAQVIVSNPPFPKDGDSCTIIFDAALGNAGLKDVAPPIYAHTGVITNLSASTADWKYVIAGWTENIPKALLTPLGNNKYQFKIKPSVRSFYGVPSYEQITKMAFVFRNADSKKEGKNADGSDIFLDVYSNTFNVNIVLPVSRSLFLKLNDPIPVSAISPAADSMKILLNGIQIKAVAGKNITDTLMASNSASNWVKQWVKIVAINSTGSVADSFFYTTIPSPQVAALPAGIVDGINYIDNQTVVLSLYAPGKNNIFVIGDFNNWANDSGFYMKITPDGTRFWLQINNLVPKQEYIFQYLVDGTLYIGDPYADKVSDPEDQYISAVTYPGLKPYPAGKAKGVATYLQPGQDPYPWNMTPFTPPQVSDLIVYELLIRDFTVNHDYPSLIDTLDYLKKLGINAIELMPVMEFEGNVSWGYNPDYSFAVDKYYGTKNGLKNFVEAAHARGIAVILDIVCNHHFGQSPLVRLYWDATNQQPAAVSPWFNQVPKHPYNVGYDFNHESFQTRTYMERLIKYWVEEFHVDGYRFDLSKGFTQKNSYPDNVSLWGQYDAGRVATLKRYTEALHSVNPKAYMILEHLADNSEETELAANNMLLWGNITGAYEEGAMGYNNGGKSDFSWASYQKRGWGSPQLVAYMESHDEERMMYKNVTWGNAMMEPYYNTKDTGTALHRMELAANFFFTIPGPKMIWQFEELGYDYSINYPSGTSDSRLAPKPIRWDYLSDWRRVYTKNIFAALMGLKKTEPVFNTSIYSLDVAGTVKRIWLKHSTMDVTVLGNFDVSGLNVIPGFTRKGMWYEFFTGDSLNVADTAASLSFAAGEYRLYTTVKLSKPNFTGFDDKNLQGLNNQHLLLYPNPSDGLLNFVINLPQTSTVEVTVFNMLGHVVSKVAFDHLQPGMNNFSLDLHAGNPDKIPCGLYFFKLDAGSFHESGKFI
ncbi:MAG: alpha-amylase family glycosyl hydrolase [Bacteroidetes bacterium]|nr:alpha-amylase family glycosyl hydrolase [Bacteroidota bacterium]